jgi:predicted TIM-barrel fold metal-dependent hydrolase
MHPETITSGNTSATEKDEDRDSHRHRRTLDLAGPDLRPYRDAAPSPTSGMLNPALLHHALSVTTIDRLIFSTDYPFQRPTGEEITTFLGHLASDADREKFSSLNAAALYDLNL